MTWVITAVAVSAVVGARLQSNAAKADEIEIEKQADEEKIITLASGVSLG